MTFFLPNSPQSAPKEISEWMNVVKGRLEQIPVLTRGIAITSPIQGNIPYYGGTAGWSPLAPNITGKILQTNGTSGANPSWVYPSSFLVQGTGITVTGTGTSTIALAAIPNNNIISNISGTSQPPSPNTLTATIDSAIGGTQGNVLYRGTSAWSILPVGTSVDQFLQTGGTAANPSWKVPSNVIGTTTNGTAATGYVGEYISSTVVSTSAIALSSGTSANVTSVVLTAGDWDVWGSVDYVAAASTTATLFKGGINTASATLPAVGNSAYAQIGIAVGTSTPMPAFPVGMTSLQLSGTSTAFLVTQATFATSTIGGFGNISARRRR